MKIETTIPPRKDGTVTVDVEGAKYVFKTDEETGALVCDVANERHVGFLLGLGDFMPADEADFAAGLQLTEVDTDPEGEGEDDPEDEEPNMDAPPIEEPASVVSAPPATPKVAKPRTGKAAK